MQGVVFKQWYKPRSEPQTPILNVKHVVYIATRPGVARNPGCGWGLWGKLPGQWNSGMVQDLRTARQIVRAESGQTTLYRVVLSVDKDTAQPKDLYHRGSWQPLVDAAVAAIAKENGIAPECFCYVAAMHYKKNHPHVHIVWWEGENRDGIRNLSKEGMSEEKFSIYAEHVRASVDRALFPEEIRQAQKQQEAERKLLREKFSWVIPEEPARPLDLDHIPRQAADRLAEQYARLIVELPEKGALKYRYLPPKYKELMQEYIDEVLKISDFQPFLRAYEAATDEISRLYGNGEETMRFNREKAMEELYRALGNSLLTGLKDARQQLRDQTLYEQTEYEELRMLLTGRARLILPANEGYRRLLALLPKQRTPTCILLSSRLFRDQLKATVQELMDDLPIRSRVKWYTSAKAKELGIDSKKQTVWEYRSGVERGVYSMLQSAVLEQLQQDALYVQQLAMGEMFLSAIRLFHASQRQSARQTSTLERARSDEKSEAQRKDLRQKLSQAGAWSME